MKKTIMVALALAMILPVGFAAAQNSLCITNGGTPACSPADATALVGSHSLKLNWANSTNNTHVSTSEPSLETTYTTSFRWRRDDEIFADDNDFTLVGVARGADIAWKLILKLKTGTPDRHKLSWRCFHNPGAGAINVQNANVNPTADRKYTLEWAAASGPGANNGICRFYRDDVLLGERTDMNNDQVNINFSRWGIVNSAPSDAVGAYYFDEFESFR